MPIDPDYLKRRQFPTVRQSYDEKDCMLYALGIGMGMDPQDAQMLRFVFEEELRVVPSQAVMLAHPGFWADEPDLNIDWPKLLHSEQEIVFHRPLPPVATVEATQRITQCIDKGERLGALIVTERTVRDVGSGEDICTLFTTVLARGDGGFGGERRATPKQNNVPTRPPDKVCDLETLPQQALLYRLTGDFNPLHASPEVARRAGFERPILHGLCTMGVVTHALLKCCCDYDPARFRRLQLRFSAPVYPGETIRTEIWEGEAPGAVAFRARSVEQDKVVISNGRLVLGD